MKQKSISFYVYAWDTVCTINGAPLMAQRDSKYLQSLLINEEVKCIVIMR